LQVLLKDKMNVLLLLLPFAIISKAVGWAAGATFLLSLLPLCSLAEVRRTSSSSSNASSSSTAPQQQQQQQQQQQHARLLTM
jgi:hypothetical protein